MLGDEFFTIRLKASCGPPQGWQKVRYPQAGLDIIFHVLFLFAYDATNGLQRHAERHEDVPPSGGSFSLSLRSSLLGRRWRCEGQLMGCCQREGNLISLISWRTDMRNDKATGGVQRG